MARQPAPRIETPAPESVSPEEGVAALSETPAPAPKLSDEVPLIAPAGRVRCKIVYGTYFESAGAQHGTGTIVDLDAAEAQRLVDIGVAEIVK